MFPFPVCSPVTCRPQDELTPGQHGVLNQYAGVW